MKVCSNKNCIHGGVPQAESNFHKSSITSDSYHIWCKDCRYKYNRRLSAEERKDNYRDNHLKSRYGISLDDFNDMIIHQDNKCDGCGRIFTKDDPPFVHHDHETGSVIGLWHHLCNCAEGFMKTSDVAFNIAEAMQGYEMKRSLLR